MGYSGTSATEIQVVSPMYFTNADIVVASQPFAAAQTFNTSNMIATFNFGSIAASQVTVPLPSYLTSSSLIGYVDLNVDARHWVAQTIS